MTSPNGSCVGGFGKEVEQELLGPTLAIAANLVLGIRTVKWPATHSEGLSDAEWDKKIEHSVRTARAVLSHLTTRHLNCSVLVKSPGTWQRTKDMAR
jgi:hypothetical protein